MIEKYKALEAENERLKLRHEAHVKMLGELLAVLHADGGHYQYEHGTEKAVADSITNHYELTRQLAELKGGLTYRNSLVCRLEKQLAEYKADAARLGWILNNDTALGVYMMYDSDDFRYVHSEEVIELADAAMKGAQNDV